MLNRQGLPNRSIIGGCKMLKFGEDLCSATIIGRLGIRGESIGIEWNDVRGSDVDCEIVQDLDPVCVKRCSVLTEDY